MKGPRKLEPEELELKDIEEEIYCETHGMTREQYAAEQRQMIEDLMAIEHELERDSQLRQTVVGEAHVRDQQCFTDDDTYDDYDYFEDFYELEPLDADGH